MQEEIVSLIAETAADKKALDIAVLDLEGISILTDYFIICSGKTDVQVKAIARAIEEKMEVKLDRLVERKEGAEQGKWILLDYGDIIVHIFRQQERKYYQLERLWGDAKRVAWNK
ncbi:ribosome silencing factor [Fuchsiella alkaliacetigena]|uniref:ribosome silencing factor n=1 Tax=Fuchsiella alkaliacetigena TaxID=957042 RepID=UPI00200A793E|nr:ribosome silencing factor [Fuchsiella alkaliacetigena]MCK8825194.1 ribosome silencing factor [Fuchsiella alkaliacetigena]